MAYNPQNISTVVSIAALRLIVGLGTVTVLGSQGGIFNWVLASTATDDGGTVINPTGNSGAGRWLRNFGQPVLPEWWGAAGNGISLNSSAVSIANTTSALTVAGASFSNATLDVGKTIQVPGAGVAGGPLSATILNVISATQVGISAAASTSLASVAETITYGTDDTSALNSAFAYAAINSAEEIRFGGQYLVSSIAITGVNGIRMRGAGSIIGRADTVGSSALMNFLNCSNVACDGELGITCSYNSGYAAAVWVHTNGTAASQNFRWTAFSVNGATLGLRIGDVNFADAVNSEHAFDFQSSYGCPNVVQVEGSETLVELRGQIIANSFGGNTAWAALTQTTLTIIGAECRVMGGELVHASTSTGAMISFQPVTSPSLGTVWGQVKVLGTYCESAAPLAVTSNPGALASPVTGGLISFVGVTGYHGLDSFALIQGDTTYIGDIVVSDTCRFYKTTGGVRTNTNVSMANNSANVFVGDAAFAKNFIQGLLGLSGGTLRFTHRQLLHVSAIASQVIANNATATLVYTTVDTTGDLGRYNTQYSAGVFTVPPGGLKGVAIIANISQSALAGVLYVNYNGTLIASSAITANGQVGMFFSQLNGGDTLAIQYLNQAGSSVTITGGAIDNFNIMAHN